MPPIERDVVVIGAGPSGLTAAHELRKAGRTAAVLEARGRVGGRTLTKPAHAFSALKAVHMAASAGSFSNLVDEDFILDRRIVGTVQGVSQTLAQRLGDDHHIMYEDPRGTLVGFVSDEKADAMFALDEKERRDVILTDLARFLGDEALTPDVYYESDFGSEEWTRGAYATSYDLGGLHRFGPDQNKNVGPMYFSSSDLAGEGYQHVDGAIRMGHLAAGNIVDRAQA